ncbi:MAG: PDZ domain-containing protein [Edaphobacter sp.]
MTIKHRVRLEAMTLVLPVLAMTCLSDQAMAMSVWKPVAVGIHAAANTGAPAGAAQGYLGVDIRDVSTAQVAALKLKDTRGAEIIHVDHDGPAGKLGLRQHDVILEMNGQQIEGQEQLRRLLHEMPAGRSVTFVISRDGQRQTMATQLANREEVARRAWEQHLVVPDPGPDNGPAPHAGSSFLHADPRPGIGARARRDFLLGSSTILSASFTGVHLEIIGPQLADFFGVEGNAGLLVRSVEANSPAAEAGLRAGDVVVRVNQVAVTTGNEWSKTIHQNRGKPVALVVLRDRHEQTVTMTPDSKKRSSVVWPFAGGAPDLVADL